MFALLQIENVLFRNIHRAFQLKLLDIRSNRSTVLNTFCIKNNRKLIEYNNTHFAQCQRSFGL